ncbi:family 16 glycoside hydrolase [Frigoribacterium sp. 2-23]|uniref:family 16 glycoside hydrolase n=1 Tax=Frigoribacterium sp. 2-23 TaxID=3415006 RepID=UPI003C6F9B41
MTRGSSGTGRLSRPGPRLLLVTALVLAATLLALLSATPGTSGAFTASVRNSTNTAVTASDFGRTTNELPYRSTFAGGTAGVSEWTTYDDPTCWKTMVVNGFGMYYDQCKSAYDGDKAVTGRADWTDYTLQADIKLDEGDQVGLLTRVTNPGKGFDNYTGYYAYITASGNLELGRTINGSYTFLTTTKIPGGVSLDTWYHLVVQMKGCTITLSQSTVGASGPSAVNSLRYIDTNCVPTAGAIGLRDFNARGAWRFVTVTAGANDTALSTAKIPYNSPWKTGLSPGFTTYGGTWRNDEVAETYSNTADGKGNKSVETTQNWTDLSLTGEVRFDAAPMSYLDAGFNVRVRNPGVGTDQLDGYYAGISSTSLIIGRHDAGRWTEFVRTPLAATVTQGEWQHLTVEMVGCRITATAQATNGGAQTSASYLDTGCTGTTGTVGVRTLAIPASFRSLAVTPR